MLDCWTWMEKSAATPRRRDFWIHRWWLSRMNSWIVHLLIRSCVSEYEKRYRRCDIFFLSRLVEISIEAFFRKMKNLFIASIDLYYPVNLLKRKMRKFYISERCKIYLLSINFYSLLNLNQTKGEKFLHFGKIYLLNLLSINFYYPLNLVKRKMDNFYTSEKCKIYLLSFNFYYLLNLIFLHFWNM